MSSKVSLPAVKAPKKGRVLFLVAFVIGLCFVVTDPAGSAAAVNDLRESLATFASQFGGEQG